MKCNVSKTDKAFRIFVGIVFLMLGVYFETWFGLIGLLPLYTVSIAWCPKQLFCAEPSENWWHKCCQRCC